MRPIATGGTLSRRQQATAERADELFRDRQQEIFKSTDRLFAGLMLFQWLAGIVAALLISPRTWQGAESSVHPHVWAAVFLGAAINVFPIALALLRPGQATTRYTIAVAQMLMSALLIHISGGRIETHFHLFGSLVILSFYRDWRVLIPATMVVALDHLIRGIYFPLSVYGVLEASPWRSLEHAGWILFEDVFLFHSCIRSLKEMRSIAGHTAQLEITNQIIEEKVVQRTAEVKASEERFRLLMEGVQDYAIVMLDCDGHIVSWNEGAKRIQGFSANQILGQHVSRLYTNEDIGAGLPVIELATASKENHFESEGWRVRSDGTRFWANAVFTALHDERGELRGFSQVTRDITQAREAEKALRDSEEQFKSVMSNVPGMVYQFVLHADGSTEVPFVSEGSQELLELQPDAIRKNPVSLLKLIRAEDRDGFANSMALSASRLLPWVWEGQFQTVSGKTKWVHAASRPRRISESDTMWDALLMDITARKEAEQERDRFFTMSPDMLGIAGMDGYFKRLNPAFSEILGYTAAELMAQPFLDFVHPEDRDSTVVAVQKLSGGGTIVGFENRYRKKDGSWRWIEWKSVSVPEDGVIYAVARDVTARKEDKAALLKANKELEEALALVAAQSRTDGLTGLNNRRALDIALVHEFARTQRFDLQFALLMLDVDHFKAFNDNFGHLAGDEVLQCVADVLKAEVRATDFAARYGGEEFVILLPETPVEGALLLAERIRERVQTLPTHHRQITVSIGIACFNSTISDGKTLLATADSALYVAKSQGRNQVVHVQPHDSIRSQN